MVKKIICECIDVYTKHDGDGNEKLTVCLTTLRHMKLEIKTELIEKCKNTAEELEQN